MPVKTPTPQGISRLLGTKFPRAVAKLRGGRAGFNVARAYWAPDGVMVNHWTNTMADTRKREREMLDRYAALIAEAGYSTEYDEQKNLLLVTGAG